LLRYDGIGADSEIPSAPAPVTRGYLLALLCGATVVPAPGPGRTSAASSPIEAPRGRPCRRDGEDADMSARAEMSAVRTRRRVMARRVRADDRAGALWHRHCSLVGM